MKTLLVKNLQIQIKLYLRKVKTIYLATLLNSLFCPPNETIAQLTEKTKLMAQKCSQQIRVSSTSVDQSNDMSNDSAMRQQVATFKSYISETETETIIFPDVLQSPLQCLGVKFSSLNRLIKDRCSFMSTASYTCNTFPRQKKPKKATAKWFIKVSL